jgi:hypothetical protein
MRTILYLAIVALIATSSCSSSDSSSDSGSEVPAEVEQVIRDNQQAIEDQDVDAWYATVTDDYFNREYMYGFETQTLWPTWVKEEDTANETAHRIEFNDRAVPTPGDEWIVTGDGPWFVSMSQAWATEIVEWDGNTTYVVVDRDGTKKVASVYFSGTATELQ